MFNENKGFKLFVDGEIVGVTRVFTDVEPERNYRRLVVILHLGKEIRKDLKLSQLVLWDVIGEVKKLPWFQSYIKLYMANFLPISKYENLGFATPADNSSVVPGEAWF